MTLPQIWNALYQGKPPRPGRKRFGSQAEAAQWREEQQARAEEAGRKARFAEHKARRKATRGF